jgi:hypothetical protein
LGKGRNELKGQDYYGYGRFGPKVSGHTVSDESDFKDSVD